MEQIAPDVYIETGYRRVTVGALLTDDGWVCIDTPPYPREARAWRATLAEISDRPVRYVINTDHHRDRILGNQWFDAPVLAHQVTAETMLTHSSMFISQAAEALSADNNELVEIASLKLIAPQISYSEKLYLICGDLEIILQSRPSTNRGNTWVAVPDKKVRFVGDTVVVNRHPYLTDSISLSYLNALRELRFSRWDTWTLVPGRGPVIQSAQTKALSAYLRLARRRVKSLYITDHTRTEVSTLLPEMLPVFPYNEEKPEEVQHRVRATLEAIYDEYRQQDVDFLER